MNEWTRQISPMLRVVTRLGAGYTYDIVLAIKIEDDVLWYMGISGNVISSKYGFFAYAEALIHDKWMAIE